MRSLSHETPPLLTLPHIFARPPPPYRREIIFEQPLRPVDWQHSDVIAKIRYSTEVQHFQDAEH